MDQVMTIGAICRELKVSRTTVRIWELEGRVAPIREAHGGRRLFTSGDLARLREMREDELSRREAGRDLLATGVH